MASKREKLVNEKILVNKANIANNAISVLDDTPPTSDDNSTINESIPRGSSHSDGSAELYISPSQEIGESSPCDGAELKVIAEDEPKEEPTEEPKSMIPETDEEPTVIEAKVVPLMNYEETIPNVTDDEVDEVPSPLDYATQLDAILCDSVRKACVTLGEDKYALCESGTTLNSLILRWGAEDDESKGSAGNYAAPVRVYCSNVGDSRCVMLKAYDTKHALVSSSFAMHSKSPQTTSAPSSPPQIAQSMSLDSSLHASSPSLKLGSQHRSSMGLSALSNAPSSSAKANRFVAVHLMSEDHKLTLHRERLRIVNTTGGKITSGSEKECWHALPADASAIYLPHYAKTPPPLNFRGLPPIPQPGKRCNMMITVTVGGVLMLVMFVFQL